jgi:hypothetical protein
VVLVKNSDVEQTVNKESLHDENGADRVDIAKGGGTTLFAEMDISSKITVADSSVLTQSQTQPLHPLKPIKIRLAAPKQKNEKEENNTTAAGAVLNKNSDNSEISTDNIIGGGPDGGLSTTTNTRSRRRSRNASMNRRGQDILDFGSDGANGGDVVGLDVNGQVTVLNEDDPAFLMNFGGGSGGGSAILIYDDDDDDDFEPARQRIRRKNASGSNNSKSRKDGVFAMTGMEYSTGPNQTPGQQPNSNIKRRSSSGLGPPSSVAVTNTSGSSQMKQSTLTHSFSSSFFGKPAMPASASITFSNPIALSAETVQPSLASLPPLSNTSTSTSSILIASPPYNLTGTEPRTQFLVSMLAKLPTEQLHYVACCLNQILNGHNHSGIGGASAPVTLQKSKTDGSIPIPHLTAVSSNSGMLAGYSHGGIANGSPQRSGGRSRRRSSGAGVGVGNEKQGGVVDMEVDSNKIHFQNPSLIGMGTITNGSSLSSSLSASSLDVGDVNQPTRPQQHQKQQQHLADVEVTEFEVDVGELSVGDWGQVCKVLEKVVGL